MLNRNTLGLPPIRTTLALVIALMLLSFTVLLRAHAAAGDLDPSFGNGGKVTTSFLDSFGSGEAHAVALQPDGKIVTAGATANRGNFNVDFALARYNNNGSLDPTFGSGGKVTTGFGFNQFALANAMAIQPDGKIIAAGFTTGSGKFALARYNSDGSLDQSFGSGGRVPGEIDVVPGSNNVASAVALQPDGRIVVAGTTCASQECDPNEESFALARYKSDGSLDDSFGVGGVTTTNFFADFDSAHALAIQADGKIVAAGFTFSQEGPDSFALARYNNNGSLEAGFGVGGKVTTDFFGDFDGASANALAIQPDGKIVAVGQAVKDSMGGFALARYDGSSLSFDTCLQDESSGSILQINTVTGNYQFSSCSGFTIGGSGSLAKRGNTITLQHVAADRRVMAKLDGNRATATIQILSQRLTFTITDRNTANNTCSCQ